ncbi:hypothetical protein AvCA_19060 [Azotobacter vinelandii CA]|uniref:Uncharacterized protein n=2 Tax=Azotobacter vinelandii TaxID=354 RepID=C1DED3_AZOVD|nr:hypothetical protein [Azotobacter vinelandii]ACO78118.1 hypothetical protein Avin_19060 [Azotobacter vinelandii DJ]AGK15123.1 hypothetical protein AvCA_19060 [Azotobacter vinelandii CA]AGK20270.1 hypothetical protein AvCA6_19060 [Azotobacter vinelandii CA6]SFY00941.1 hypothetical protein SAMN04244547_03594 [Azotobacter vinelandii]
MIRKHFAGVVASAQALGVPAQASAGTVVSVSVVETSTGEFV